MFSAFNRNREAMGEYRLLILSRQAEKTAPIYSSLISNCLGTVYMQRPEARGSHMLFVLIRGTRHSVRFSPPDWWKTRYSAEPRSGQDWTRDSWPAASRWMSRREFNPLAIHLLWLIREHIKNVSWCTYFAKNTRYKLLTHRSTAIFILDVCTLSQPQRIIYQSETKCTTTSCYHQY